VYQTDNLMSFNNIGAVRRHSCYPTSYKLKPITISRLNRYAYTDLCACFNARTQSLRRALTLADGVDRDGGEGWWWVVACGVCVDG
jgi:hypothetical protein